MRIEELTLREVRDVYQKRMTVDFPRHELKYLSTIEDSIGKGRYRCLGLKDAGELLAYAFFVCLTVNGEEHWLLDYYAIDSNHRGEGIGSRFLRMLCGDYLQGAGCALLEVDDPAYACDEAERETRERRRNLGLPPALIMPKKPAPDSPRLNDSRR